MSRAAKQRWASGVYADKAANTPNLRKGRSSKDVKKEWKRRRKTLRMVPQDELVAWAREHEGMLDVKAFKAEHPDSDLFQVANSTRCGVFRHQKGSQAYFLNEGQAKRGASA